MSARLALSTGTPGMETTRTGSRLPAMTRHPKPASRRATSSIRPQDRARCDAYSTATSNRLMDNLSYLKNRRIPRKLQWTAGSNPCRNQSPTSVTLVAMPRILLILTFAALPAFSQPKVLKATPQTVQWGYYSADAKPVLTVKSGEIVRVEAVSTGSVAMFTRLGALEDDALRDLKLITAEVKDKGPGGHVLTGPIGVEGAEPGNVLQVDILEIAPRSKYGYNSFGPNSGILTDDFPYSRSKLVPLDLERE